MFVYFQRTVVPSVLLAAVLFTTGCGNPNYLENTTKKPPVTLTLEQIEYAKAHLSEIRPGIERGEMWHQLRPMLGNILPKITNDSAPASHTSQSYDLGHGYVLRLFFDPKNDVIFRRAEIVKR